MRGAGDRVIAPPMNGRALLTIFGAMLICGCEEKKKEVAITETRPPTSRDGPVKLFATEDERFQDIKPSPVTAPTPVGWIPQPAREFRLLNYRFGSSGTGEVWVSLADGSVINNVNRWLGQFKKAPLDEAGLAALPTVIVAGAQGVWVNAEGDYVSGKGAEPQTGYALAGAVASVGGRILTVKMVGPKAEVDAAKPELESFAKSLRIVE